MKKFETPEIEVQKFVVEDIMSVSMGGGMGGDHETELDPALYEEP